MNLVKASGVLIALSVLFLSGCSGAPASPIPRATATVGPTPTPTLAPAPANGDCAFVAHSAALTKAGAKPTPKEPVIKGTINDASNKIYFVPGMRRYGAETVDEQKGERWFCTEQEAVAAGWVASATPRA